MSPTFALWKLWAGKYSLPVAFWGFGFAGWWGVWIAVNATLRFLNADTAAHFLIAAGLAVILAYTFVACVGIWRSAKRLESFSNAAVAARIAVGFWALYWVAELTAGGLAHRLYGDLMSPN